MILYMLILTKMCSEVLDKLDPVFLLLPEFEMAILAGSSNEVSPKAHTCMHGTL